MAVERRLLTYPGIRLDAPEFRSLESAVSADFDSTLRGLVTGLNNPYLIRGFDVVIPSSNIPAISLAIQVADSAILHSSAAESGTILSVPAGTPNDILSPSNPNVIGAFQNGVPNYVSLAYVRSIDDASVDQTFGWDQSQKIELQRDVPIAYTLNYQYVISTTGFSTNLPLYIVGVSSSGTVTYITKAVPSLFRLGSGGAVPNPQNTFQFDNLTNPQTGTIREWVNSSPLVANPVSVVPGNPSYAFNLGDWSITNLKQWMDAVMTRFTQLTNSAYWYIGSNLTNNPNLSDLFFDAAGSVFTGSGFLSFNYILQAGTLLSGSYESTFTDQNLVVGQSYVLGVSSQQRGTLVNFNNGQLIVNSLTGENFIYGEVLQNRITNNINYSLFSLTNYADSVYRYGYYARSSFSPGATTSITSWSYDTAATSQQAVTITAPGHTLNVGNLVEITGLVAGSNAPNGVYFVRQSNQTAGTFVILSGQLITGSPTIASATVALSGSQIGHPYYPSIPFSAWTYASTTITLSQFQQMPPYVAPFSLSGTTDGSTAVITGLSSTANISVGKMVTGTGIQTNSFVQAILSSSSIQLTKVTTSAGTSPLTFFDMIVVSGTTATTNAPNGRWPVTNVTSTGSVQFTATSAPTGTAGVSDALVYPDYYQFQLTVSGAVPSNYDAINALAIADGPASFWYPIGAYTLPVQPTASGPIIFDGVIATSSVANPVQIASITYSAGDLLVTTNAPHNLVNTTNATVTIYGQPSVTGYAQTYTGVNITVTGSESFTLSPYGSTVLPNLGTYTNGGSDQVFLSSPGNPYPGPIQWSGDLVIKGVIGDLRYIVPETATATGQPLANQYNVNGVTGTAFLEDGEVMYIELLRNLPVSSGASFTCSSPTFITGASFLDVNGNPLNSGPYGDFVKFLNEDESKWVRIGSFTGATQANLLNDDGQVPNATQRPPNTGPLVYCKSEYMQVVVQPYYLVPASTDVYWLAMRRDNGGQPTVYFRNLQLNVGEVTQVNDNITNNLLVYTGAFTEGATEPNYTQADPSGPWVYSQTLTITAVDVNTQTVTFAAPPTLNFQKGDTFQYVSGSTVLNFTVEFPISGVSVQVEQSVSSLPSSGTVQYFQNDFSILDSDNLTLAARKEDRELATVNTSLSRPVYDEYAYVQQINLTGSGTVQAGRYIYTGPIDNPTGLAWVMQGTAPVTITIDNAPVTMPGGHPSIGSNAILVSIIAGASSFTDGTAVNQINFANNTSVSTGFTINNPGNPAFPAPIIVGGVGTGVQLVLPPNRRTQVYSSGGGYNIWPANSYYKASSVAALTGEDLLVIANDSIRTAGLDYSEVFSGPKAIIEMVRTLPANTTIRFRSMATYGSVLASTGGGVSLQIAYNNGNVINGLAGVPVTINAGDAASGGVAFSIAGSLKINGYNGSSVVGIIEGGADQQFSIGSELNKPLDAWTAFDMVKTHTSYTGSAETRLTAAATTTTTAATNIGGTAVTVPSGSTIRVCATGSAREGSDAGHAAFRVEGAFANVGGTLYALSPPESHVLGFDGHGSYYAMTLVVVGSQVMVAAFGDTTGVYWSFGVDYQLVASAT